jgi:type VI secretion system protein VasG
MSSTSLKTLVSKLNDTAKSALQQAANLCMARTHYEVDLEHVFLALLDMPQSDFSVLCKRFGVSSTALERDLDAEVAQFKNGNTRTPVFSSHLPVLLEHAWLIASLESRTAGIRTSHLLLALLTAPDLKQRSSRWMSSNTTWANSPPAPWKQSKPLQARMKTHLTPPLKSRNPKKPRP